MRNHKMELGEAPAVCDGTYKRHAVELTLSPGRTIKAIAKELGIAPGALYRWRRRFASRIPRANSKNPKRRIDGCAQRRFGGASTRLCKKNHGTSSPKHPRAV